MMNLLKERLERENCSCVIGKGEEVRSFNRRGVADLYDLLKEEPDFLRDASVADKVIGKGAAAILVNGSVKSVFSRVISESALDLFRRYDVEVSYDCCVPYIINRDKTGWCPLETRCKDIFDREELMNEVDAFVRMIRNGQAVLSK